MLELYQRNCSACGHGTCSFSTVTTWIKRIKSGIETVDSAPGRGKPASVATSKINDKVNALLKIDAQMTTRQVARCLYMSTGSTYKILKKKYELAVFLLGGFPIHCRMAKRGAMFSIASKNA